MQEQNWEANFHMLSFCVVCTGLELANDTRMRKTCAFKVNAQSLKKGIPKKRTNPKKRKNTNPKKEQKVYFPLWQLTLRITRAFKRTERKAFPILI